MQSAAACHVEIGCLFRNRGYDAGSMVAVERAQALYGYWRPKEVRVILLAESAVYTPETDLSRTVHLPADLSASGMPAGFVRLVYCLGYGEDELLGEGVGKNGGTPQFWKVLQSCVHPSGTKQDFAPILKGRTRSLHRRISNKVALLHTLKERGVWLVDASIVALYPKPSPSLVRQAVEVSWDRHIEPVLTDAAPRAILCVGLGVRDTLWSRLARIGIPWSAVPQPNAHLPAKAHMRIFETYYRLAQDPAYIERVNDQIWTAP